MHLVLVEAGGPKRWVMPCFWVRHTPQAPQPRHNFSSLVGVYPAAQYVASKLPYSRTYTCTCISWPEIFATAELLKSSTHWHVLMFLSLQCGPMTSCAPHPVCLWVPVASTGLQLTRRSCAFSAPGEEFSLSLHRRPRYHSRNCRV